MERGRSSASAGDARARERERAATSLGFHFDTTHHKRDKGRKEMEMTNSMSRADVERALADVRASAIALTRERARASELANELLRERRARAGVEMRARALSVALTCAKIERASGEGRFGGANARMDEENEGGKDDLDASDGSRARASVERSVETRSRTSARTRTRTRTRSMSTSTSTSTSSSATEDEDERETSWNGNDDATSSRLERAPSRSMTFARTTTENNAVEDDDGRDNRKEMNEERLSGRDRRVVGGNGADDDAGRERANADWTMDERTTHRHVTAVAVELARVHANANANALDVSRITSEFFARRHGSHALSEAHRRTFLDAVKRHRARSAWAHAFARLHDVHTVGVAFFASVFARCESQVREHAGDGAPIVNVDAALEALTTTLLRRRLPAPSALVVDAIRRTAEHSDGVSSVRASTIIEHGFAIIDDAHAGVRRACRSAFVERHPAGVTLAHHRALAKVLEDAAHALELAPMDVDDVAIEIANQRGDGSECVTLERFVGVASSALFAARCARADVADEPATALGAPPLSSASIDLVTSLSLVTYAWDIAKAVIDRWLAKWLPRAAGAAAGRAALPVAQSIDTSKRRVVRAHIERLRKLRQTADYAIQAARAFAHARVKSASDDCRRAWDAYASAACALESAVVAHRRSVGIVHIAGDFWCKDIT